jgi:hypothetical protein
VEKFSPHHQSQSKREPNEPIPTYGYSWPQRQCVRLEWETDRARRYGETAIGGRYSMQHVVLTPGAEYSATGVTPMALMQHVLSDAAIPPRLKCFLLMSVPFLIITNYAATTSPYPRTHSASPNVSTFHQHNVFKPLGASMSV